jgi:hypothetical protein
MTPVEQKCVDLVRRRFTWAVELDDLIESGGIPDDAEMTIAFVEIASEIAAIAREVAP